MERRGTTSIITIAREAKRNAIDASVTRGLDEALNELDDDPALDCGILTGGPNLFCAGADLAAGPGDRTDRGGIAGLIHRTRVKPLIAAVEGFALGGGMELVLCCDLIVASTTASFGLPEVQRGLMPDFGGAFRVMRALPANVARELLLTGRRLDAARAERLGFVNALAEPGGALEVALELADAISTGAPLAVRASLKVANAALNGDESALWQLSDAEHAALCRTDDVREGIQAFFDRRKPRWSGR